MIQKKFAKGELISREGTPGSEMYIIRSGRVGVFKLVNGEKVNLGAVETNDMVGEMALFMDEVRTASVEALEPTELLILDKEAVMQQIHDDPKFAFAMLRKLAKKIQDAHKVISRLEGEKKSLEMIYGKR